MREEPIRRIGALVTGEEAQGQLKFVKDFSFGRLGGVGGVKSDFRLDKNEEWKNGARRRNNPEFLIFRGKKRRWSSLKFDTGRVGLRKVDGTSFGDSNQGSPRKRTWRGKKEF